MSWPLDFDTDCLCSHKLVLLEQIESQNLPEKWGGTRELGQLSNEPHAGDICMGGEVPLYYKSTTKSIDDVKGLNSIYKQSIVAGSIFTLKYPVRVQSNLIWKFRIEGGEIEFGIQRRRVRSVEESPDSKSSLNSEEPEVPALPENEAQSFQKKKPSTSTNSEKDVIGALDQPSVNMDEKETSTTSPLKEQDESQSAPRHNPLLDSSRYQEPSDLKKAITDQLTSELVLMKKESDALKQIKDRTEEKIDLFDETDEDENIPLENIFQKVKVLSKDSQGGCLTCDPGYVYTLTFDNSESMFRSRKLFYSVNLEDTLKKKEDTVIAETGEQRSMGMADLMNFVKDLIEMEEKKKNGLLQPSTTKNTAV
ncbi:uncharacterized protein LOC111695416 [Eurytemora carolleeae]|uniref:uncharacterized protein LOC111695416 n=1 Tax=Eurytemora carolleeae TaxID=1294199 RepID=UPI000C764452|nr:uncharacterized protein LOC111695416 [Eurytemora carolleeae]|eukprot:XP_023320506.1 uncharacterized protein LOC111695416 [Eurytemora affinis]